MEKRKEGGKEGHEEERGEVRKKGKIKGGKQE